MTTAHVTLAERKSAAVHDYRIGLRVADIRARHRMATQTMYAALDAAEVPRRCAAAGRKHAYTIAELSRAKALLAQGKTALEVARALDRRVKPLRRFLARNEVAVDRALAGRASARQRATNWSPEQIWILETLYPLGVPARMMAPFIGKRPATIWTRCSRRGLTRPFHQIGLKAAAQFDVALILAVARLRRDGHTVREIGGGLWDIDDRETLDHDQVVMRAEWEARKGARHA